MYVQPRNDPFSPSGVFPNDQSARPQVEGTLPASAGSLAYASSGRLGATRAPFDPGIPLPLDDEGRPLAAISQPVPGEREELRAPLTREALRRGGDRYAIYCAPCHSVAGDGDGMVVRRGFPAPPSFHTERLRNAPDSHFYAVMTHGYGAMYSYASRVTSEDRWAIVAYIRALQYSQNVPVGDLSASEAAQVRAARR